MRPVKPSFKGLWQSFDEVNFGHDRTLNLRESLPSAVEARNIPMLINTRQARMDGRRP